MKLLVDMNLSPDWVPLLAAHGWEACLVTVLHRRHCSVSDSLAASRFKMRPTRCLAR